MVSRKKVVVFTGAGISAESGLSTYRGSEGIWSNWNQLEVASFGGWKKDRGKVLEYWNQRKRVVENAKPNKAHEALVALELKFDVTVITQNIDDLHEKAGSTHINKSRQRVGPRQRQTRPVEEAFWESLN
ncbi:hypothetical protein RE428_30780 [Marinobacter nanhaiticus D15-8W]|uniref:SIR2 family NAD-dependent protein deacylase n=1 Tax=Marinobacter nanhaiticus TaxID=1305740 RepID=UPI0002CCB988|nr:Sir2 family NAD-dependent protein deacetylase [Marinobacter nanhaiticus]BES72060.1 hypothetical protein RE428_30780 [Marinobacter nanhaiticus D15-8W]